MKRFLLFISALFITTLSFGQIEIWQENFETASGFTTSPDQFTDGSGDYFTRTNGSDVTAKISNISGYYFFGAMDTDGEAPNQAVGLTVTFPEVDITGFTDLIFKGFFAEDASSDGKNDWDAGSNVTVQYSIDGGTLQNIIAFEANVDDTNQEASEDTDFDGTGDGTVLTDVLTEFTKNIANTGSSIVITVTINNLKSGDEDIAFDNFRLEGTSSTPDEEADWCNLQWPGTANIATGTSETIYAQIYEDGVTNPAGQGAGIEAWIGYSTENTNPNTWTTWIEASYHGDSQNNDEYKADLGADLPEGTFYYASRFRLNKSVFTYGGYQENAGGAWDGTTNINGMLTIATPASTTTLPYSESFDTDLGNTFAYSVQGTTKKWFHDASGSAKMTGFNDGNTEEDWLVLPGVNLDDYNNEVLTFETDWSFGVAADADNYLKLYYATDYAGIGDPSTANWTELSFTTGASGSFTGSGSISLSQITGTSVYIAFKYFYQSGDWRNWYIDNINIAKDVQSSIQDIESGVQVYSFNKNIHVNIEDVQNASISVFEISGRNVYQETAINNKTVINLESAIGTYIVKVQTQNNVYTQKVFIK